MKPRPPRLRGSPARLVFLLQDLEFGGTQRHILELAHRLDSAQFQVEVWLMIARDDMVPIARARGIPLVWLSRGQHVGPASIINLWRRLQTTRVDLLVALTVIPNIWGRILGRLHRVPLIVGNCRGGTDPQLQAERWLWPLAHHIVCNSRALKDALTRGYGVPADHLTVIPNGVDTGFFQPPSSAAKNGGPLIVLSIARMVEDKDHDTLIRAFQLVIQSHPRAELWLVGNGPRQPVVELKASRCLPPERVRFIPGQSDLRPLLHQASLLVLSSRDESLPNVLLEAMAAGLPVVATRVGGVPEVVMPGKTGWLAPPGDPAALAAAISHLLDNPETRLTFGRAGRRRVERDFSLAAMINRHQQVLARLTAQTR
ncbi:MAG: glycosyltransferase family 4 protein [Desulfobaccales bacterium]